jgi:hypothetical protein
LRFVKQETHNLRQELPSCSPRLAEDMREVK